jgi:hypothetical protein
MTDRTDTVVADTRRWLERAVIGLNLCPFAKSVHVKGQVHYAVSAATDGPALREDLLRELRDLAAIDPEVRDTTLLVAPDAFPDFLDFNHFLATADRALAELDLEGILQIAPFHPRFVFAGTRDDDITNYTNRTPYHPPRPVGRAAQGTAHPHARGQAQPGLAAQAQAGLPPVPVHRKAAAGAAGIAGGRGRPHAGRPRRGQVLPGLHPVRPVLQGAEGRPHLRHRDPAELVQKSRELAARLGFERMSFLNLSVADATLSDELPARIDVVTALHACDTATDDAIAFGLQKHAPAFMVLVPCCQAEVARTLNAGKALSLHRTPLAELWRHPLHTREMGSQITNVLRCLYLEASGYQVTVTELVGWEHSMKNELIIAKYTGQKKRSAAERLQAILEQFGIESLLETRFKLPDSPG